jgi:hypothetical protein
MAREWNETTSKFLRGHPLTRADAATDRGVLDEITRTMRDVVARDARGNPAGASRSVFPEDQRYRPGTPVLPPAKIESDPMTMRQSGLSAMDRMYELPHERKAREAAAKKAKAEEGKE